MVKKIWNWFWYRQGKVRYHIWIDEDRYIASASNKHLIAYNYGNTPELAKEAALFTLHQTLNKKKRKFLTKGNRNVLYRIK
ncbi:hypothetical protein [Bacillus sp. Marseille-P3661]|uniref:hypothetical protein n=1 Tax=Bacillus sp. Marseille-P3661 TaxID=1936234 RepID=UPI000C822F64|nr:hypothetical protein [Bacillus sp. Marseille-P3661]